jgi:hypothetical protein
MVGPHVRPSRHRLRSLGAVLVALVLVSAGCSLGGESEEASELTTTTTTDGASGAIGAVRTCDLITTNEVGEALGAEVAPLGTSATAGRCEFSTLERRPLVGIQIDRGQTPESVRARLDASGDLVEQVEPALRPTTWSPSRSIITTLHEDAFVQVVLPGSALPEEERLRRARLVLERVVARLTAFVPAQTRDLASRSYVDNLLVKVEDGEWTLGEGLVETLRLFAGEVDETTVLRSTDLASYETTGLLALAREYATDGAEPELRDEVGVLLDRLVFTRDELDRMAEPAPRTAGSREDEPTREREASAQPRRFPAQATHDCDDFYGEHNVPEGVDTCLLVHTQTTGGVTFRIYEPALEDIDLGWEDAFVVPTVQLVRETIDETVGQTFLPLGSLPSEMSIVLGAAKHQPRSPDKPRAAMQAVPDGDGGCTVTVFLNVQNSSPASFQQLLAHEFAHCFQNASFPAQQVEYGVRMWREEGLAEYLSAVAYPETNLEHRFVNALRETEIETATVFSRAYENVLWFHYLKQVLGGDAAILDIVRNGPTSGEIGDQQAYLASQPDIEEIHHEFVLATTDGTVRDLDGTAFPPATSFNAHNATLVEGLELTATFRPFGVGKFVFEVPKGMAANLTFEDEGLSVSARPFETPGAWFPVEPGDEFLAACGESSSYVLVVSSASQEVAFTAEVAQLEEYDCEECVVGEWRLELPEPFLSATAPFVNQPGLVGRTVSGNVDLSIFDDGTIDVEIDGYREVLAFEQPASEHPASSNGRASGEWRIEGGQFGAAYTFDDMVTVFEFLGTTQNVPPVYTLPGRAGPYACDEERFVYASPGGPIVTYRRR